MDVVVVLTKVVQEQQKTIAELSRKMSELERELKLKNDVAMVTTDLSRRYWDKVPTIQTGRYWRC